jgi:hypothetical protein
LESEQSENRYTAKKVTVKKGGLSKSNKTAAGTNGQWSTALGGSSSIQIEDYNHASNEFYEEVMM